MDLSLPASSDDIHATLDRVFGYSSFRPHQQEIIEDLIAGHDAFENWGQTTFLSFDLQIFRVFQGGRPRLAFTSVKVNRVLSLLMPGRGV